MRFHRGEEGFTLLEMLLSMTLLSLLLVAMFSGLQFAGHSDGRVEAVLEDSQSLDMVRDLLTRQVANAFPVETISDATSPAAANSAGAGPANPRRLLFTGRADRLAFPILRLPGQGPAGLIWAVFDITVTDGVSHLIYREYPFQPGAVVALAEQPTRSTQLAENRTGMAFQYRDKTGVWQAQWQGSDALPSVIGFHNADWPDVIVGLRVLEAAR